MIMGGGRRAAQHVTERLVPDVVGATGRQAPQLQTRPALRDAGGQPDALGGRGEEAEQDERPVLLTS